jgi:hypothetical protein
MGGVSCVFARTVVHVMSGVELVNTSAVVASCCYRGCVRPWPGRLCVRHHRMQQFAKVVIMESCLSLHWSESECGCICNAHGAQCMGLCSAG